MALARWLFVGLLGVALGASAARAAPEGEAKQRPPFEIKRARKSPLHASLLMAPRDATESVLLVAFHAGADDDGALPGLTRLAQLSLLFASRTDDGARLLRDVYQAGGALLVETGAREAVFVLRAPRARFDELASRLLRMTLKPKLSELSFEETRARALVDQLPAGSEEDLRAFFRARLLAEARREGGAFDVHPYGTDASLRAIPFEAVSRHVSSKLVPSNATVILAGAFSTARLSRVVVRAPSRAKASGGGAEPLTPEIALLTLKRWSPHDLRVQTLLVEAKDPQDAAAVRLLAALIEERVRRRLGALGVSERVRVIPSIRGFCPFLLVTVAMPSTGTVAIEPILRQELDGLAAGRFYEGEFDRNRAFALAEMRRVDQSPEALARALLAEATGARWHDAEVADKLASLSQAEFVTRVSRWLSPKRSFHSVLGPRQGR